jgi:hypothetical protein
MTHPLERRFPRPLADVDEDFELGDLDALEAEWLDERGRRGPRRGARPGTRPGARPPSRPRPPARPSAPRPPATRPGGAFGGWAPDAPPFGPALSPQPIGADAPTACTCGANPANAPGPSAFDDGQADDGVADTTDVADEVSRGGVSTAFTNWKAALFDTYPAKLPAGGGIYIVEAHGAPIYVGLARQFAHRWGGRLLSLYQMGLLGRAKAGPPFPVKVWFGTLGATDERTLRTAEHAIIRLLERGGVVARGALRNSQSVLPFRLSGLVELRNVLPRPFAARVENVPSFSRNDLHLSPNNPALFEAWFPR